MMAILPNARRYDHPFAYAIDERALPSETCSVLRALFERDLEWQLHQTFYEAWLADVSADVSDALVDEVVARSAALTGLPLGGATRVTIQRMEPGQFAGVHSDRPLVGFEAVRLVVQLNEDWRPGDGGLFQVLEEGAGGGVVREHAPRLGSGMLFALHRASLHAVTPVTRTRRTVVFNLFHLGNPSWLGDKVRALFDGMHVHALPRDLDALAVESEATLGELDTYRAACVAWVLAGWKVDPDLLRAGYRAGLRPLSCADLVGTEAEPAVTLARWVAHLRLEDFDPQLWRAVVEALGRPNPVGRMHALAADLAVVVGE